MTDSMVERVARAMATDCGLDWSAMPDKANWTAAIWSVRSWWRDRARAAIEAMREPIEDMVVAGCQHENMGDMAGRWQAMIDKALETPQKPAESEMGSNESRLNQP